MRNMCKKFCIIFLLLLCLLILSSCVISEPSATESSESNPQWLYGDLHMHTTYSDGKFSYKDVIKYCIEAGYDYVATTDHNTTSQNYEENIYSNLIIIPGVEDTTSQGHFNILGLQEPPADMYSLEEDSDEIFKQVSKKIRAAGGKMTIAHPFLTRFLWKRTFDKDNYDYLEVWNGGFDASDQHALDFWQSELEKGYVIPIVGGTDSHTETIYRSPYNVTYVNERSPEGVLNALTAGHNYIVYHPKGSPIINFSYGEYMMGDIAEYKPENELKIAISNITEKITIHLYNQTGLVYETKIEKDTKEYNYKYGVSPDDLFYRIEITGFCNKMRLITNPIYFE